MKKFIISVLCAAVFFIGLGNLVEETGARFKSDERALALIKEAQTAIGGETAVRNVRGLTITGTVTKNFEFDGTTRTEQGELEINLQLPNQFAKMMKLRHQDGSTSEKSGEFKKEVNVVVMNDGNGEAPIFKSSDSNGQKPRVFIMKKGDGDKVVPSDKNIDGKVRRVVTDENIDVLRGNGGFHQNEMFRTTLALLLTASQGTDVTFTYAGDGDIDGNACDIVEAKNGDSTVKLFLDKSSHLLRMMSYEGFKPMIFKIRRDETKNEPDVKVFERKMDKPETAEFQIRFSDYRAIDGVLLPHRWTQTVGGSADETVDVASYEINPANIAEKFQTLPRKVLVRTESKEQ